MLCVRRDSEAYRVARPVDIGEICFAIPLYGLPAIVWWGT